MSLPTLLGHLGIPRADLVGWSDGGIIALLTAIRHPERVRRVVASGANIRLDALSWNFVKWATAVPRAAWLLPMLTSFLDAPDKTAK